VDEISATEAARNFSDMLDAVEHRSQRFAIVRRGKVVAHLGPVNTGNGRGVKAVLREHGPDGEFAVDLASARELLNIEERP
jgi:antitoxin (DNA-binding transcriptional repressor) of toxin-antitoxin stability system